MENLNFEYGLKWTEKSIRFVIKKNDFSQRKHGDSYKIEKL
jgi:hypothetical protein